MKKPNFSVILVVVAAAITLPYIAAAVMGGQEWIFIGFLHNPLDGASYLAKMQQGYAGAWRFTLPFTSEPGDGAYLFLFYLFLGHLSRWIGMPLILVYHLARIAGAALLLLAIFHFLERLFSNRPDIFRIACWLTAVGAGMGWLLVLFGPTPTDFWVAEAYPFLSMYANPHFPLGLALVLWSFLDMLEEPSPQRDLRLVLFGLLLAVILPFALVVVLFIGAAWAGWSFVETRRLVWRPLVSLGLFGGPFLLYQYWAATTDPVLAGWNAQNVTPSPPLYDFLLSFSPAIILAPVGAWAFWKEKAAPERRLLIAWFCLGLVLIFLPFSLQRRFMLGFYIPTAALAACGIDVLCQRFPSLARRIVPAVFVLALPTNLLLLLLGLLGIMSRAPVFFIHQDEALALQWIGENTPPKALVLAAPEIERWIPGFTGRRVVYGHPFETIDAPLQENWVLAFYSQRGQPESEPLVERKIDYVIYGERERQIGGALVLDSFPLVFQSGEVAIYDVSGEQ